MAGDTNLGFLRFLNKGKSKVEEELDIPPLPPPPAEMLEAGGIGGIGEELPPLPEMEEAPDEISQEPPETYREITETEELPSLPEIEKEVPISSWALEEGMPIAKLTKPTITAPFRGIDKTRKTKPVFVGMDSFKNGVLRNITLIKNELKNSNEILSKLGRLEQNENILFKDLHDKMDDLQKKLMSIDKILFRG